MIDYKLLADSVDYYEGKNFKRIESPWLVTRAISDITRPKGAKDYPIIRGDREKVFVASGEQSFLYLINKGFLPQGKYQTITPCMRDEAFDIWHTKYFMKNELIWWGDTPDNALDEVIQTALGFFKKHVNDPSKLKIVHADTTSKLTLWDIEYQGIEIGSYGFRECEFCSWIFGTGLAEPRFSRILGNDDRI